MKLFSTNAASLLLEKDRRTVTKAMLGVAPDAKVNGQARWKLRKFVDALAAHERPAGGSGKGAGNGRGGDGDGELAVIYYQFDAAYQKMVALPTLPQRRACAETTLGPMIWNMDRRTREVRIARGEDETFVDLLTDKLRFLYLRGFEAPCQWSFDECHDHLREPWPDDDE